MRKAHTLYLNTDGTIAYTRMYNPGTAPAEGTTVDGLLVKYYTEEDAETYNNINIATFTTRYYFKNNQWVLRGDPPTPYYKWQNEAWTKNTDMILAEVRVYRDQKLYMSDWTQGTADSPLTEDQRADWRTYRQTLRDIMANLPADLDDPANVSWPTEPS